jgi:Na+-transporting NADH:ubiquinone oxidoreductase subunit C
VEHQVDGLAGATLTGRGVEHLVRYWLGEQGFGPYLARLAHRQQGSGA